MTLFTVVDGLSSYDIMLRRPVMNAFMAIASTSHLKQKYLAGNREGGLRGQE